VKKVLPILPFLENLVVLKRGKQVFSDLIFKVIVEEANYWKEC